MNERYSLGARNIDGNTKYMSNEIISIIWVENIFFTIFEANF